jgi:hypothetical protein
MDEGCIHPLQKTYKYNKKIKPIQNFWDINFAKMKPEDLEKNRQKETKYHQISNSQEFDIKYKEEHGSARMNKSLIKDSPHSKNKKKLENLRKSILEEVELVKFLIIDDEDKTRELIDKKKKDRLIENYKLKKIEKNNIKFNPENLYKIESKKKSNSINTYISRNNLKLNLPHLLKVDMFATFNQLKPNNNTNVKRRRSLVDPASKVRYRAKSLDLNNRVNYFKKFYISHYLKIQKEKNIEKEIREKTEKFQRREAYKKKNKKDKYYDPLKNSFSDNLYNFIKHQSPPSKNKSPISLKNNNNHFANSSENTPCINTPFNMTNYNSYLLNSQSNGPSNSSNTVFSNSNTYIKPFHNFSQSISSFKSGMSTFQNTNSLLKISKTNFSRTANSQNSNLVSSKNIKKCAANIRNKKILDKLKHDIILKCEETGGESSKIKNEIDSLIDTYHSKDGEFLRSLKNENDLQEIYEEIQQECLKFKQFQRVFIHPKGLNKKGEYISSDQNSAINQAKKIDALGSDIAFNSRKLVYNLFDTKIDEGEIINYVPDVHKFKKKSDFIKNYKEKKIKLNAVYIKKSYNTLKVKSNIINEKATSLLKTLNNI